QRSEEEQQSLGGTGGRDQLILDGHAVMQSRPRSRASVGLALNLLKVDSPGNCSAHTLVSDTRMNSCSANDLFQALDGQSVSVGSRSWRIEITGIFDQDGSSWIQMTLNGAPSYHVAIKITGTDSAADVMDALRSWLESSSKESGQVFYFER